MYYISFYIFSAFALLFFLGRVRHGTIPDNVRWCKRWRCSSTGRHKARTAEPRPSPSETLQIPGRMPRGQGERWCNAIFHKILKAWKMLHIRSVGFLSFRTFVRFSIHLISVFMHSDDGVRERFDTTMSQQHSAGKWHLDSPLSACLEDSCGPSAVGESLF